MSSYTHSHRSLQRIAQGIVRKRLLQPMLAARPGVVVLAAPSGLGKTVLAAQLATSGAFAEVHWVDAEGEHGSFVDAMSRLAHELDKDRCADDLPTTSDELAEFCAVQMAARADDQCILIVVDNAGWVCDSEKVDLLTQVVTEAPRGSILVLTTRNCGVVRRGAWCADALEMGMSDVELLELAEGVTGRTIPAGDLDRLISMSDRHPALASLLVRRWAIDGQSAPASSPDVMAARLIASLVEDQLSSDERLVLDYAAVLGSGPLDLLLTSTALPGAAALLRRAADVLPLVTISGSGKRAVFAVHQLVADALCSVDRLSRCQPEGFARIVRTLLESDSCASALELALIDGSETLTANCLIEGSGRLLAGGHHRAVCEALDALPAMTVASDPRLLLLRAECAWEDWDGAGARSGAQLALRAAEAIDDVPTTVRSRLLLARIKALTMDHAGVIGDVEPLLSSGSTYLDADAQSDAVVSLIMAFTFLGDQGGLARIAEPLRHLVSSRGSRASSAVRLSVTRGLSAGLLDGDWSTALGFFAAARSLSVNATGFSTVVLSDILAAMLSLGRFAEADAEITRLKSTKVIEGGDAVAIRLVAAFVDCITGDGADVRQAVQAAVDLDTENHDQLSMTSTLLYASAFALALREIEWGMSVSDHAVRSAMATGSSILVWLAELAQAACCAAAGDIERGRSIALRVLPQAESCGAHEHAAQARLILAYAAIVADDLPQAVHHLYTVSDYIREKSPVLTVASYLRAFPALLGPLALAMGVDNIPARVLGMLTGSFGTEAIESAAELLTPAELKRLKSRMSLEKSKQDQREHTVDLSQTVCRVRVLGGLEVTAPHGKVADRDWGKRKARLLFAMLVARAGTDVPRGEITEYLWPEMDDERALNNFYVVWSAMKRALAPHAMREVSCPFVEHIHSVCRIVPGRVVTDLDEFEEHLARARRAREKGDSEAELAAIRAAEQVYRGDVLPGDIYDDWFAPLRTRVRHSFEDAMLRAAQILDERGEPHQGLSMLRRPMEHDILREDFYQAALRLQISSGQRSAAIDTYMSCRSRLVEELGIDPSRETTALYEQVLGMEG